MSMRRESYLFSGVLHLIIASLAVFGLPQFFRDPPAVETPMVVDLVPIGIKSNPPPKQLSEPQPEPAKPEEAKPEPPKPEPPKPEPPKPEPPKPAPPPPPPPPPKPPEPEPAPILKPEAKPVQKPEPKPEAKVPEPDLSEVKPKPRPKQPEDDLDSLLKSVDKKKKPPPPPSNPLDDLLKSTDKAKPNTASTDKGNQPKPQNVKGSDQHNPNEPISMTESDAIRAHVSKFWNIPAGAKDADKLLVSIRVNVLPDGTVTDAQVVNAPFAPTSFWQAAADSARRAVRLASPLPIPKNKYDQFQDFIITFDPKQMVMGR